MSSLPSRDLGAARRIPWLPVPDYYQCLLCPQEALRVKRNELGSALLCARCFELTLPERTV